MENEYKISILLRLISGLMLFLALGYHPYSYYITLRWIVSISSFYSGWVMSKIKRHNWAWFFFIVGVLFNPIIPVYLNRSTWQIIDFAFAVVFSYSLIVNSTNKK
ncbi:MAG: hypothetical protein NC935_05710 [Candidatus Omnitrophica bacterium]|nr:hypothetical protein [Candidatus Omnitrophota bacterium]